MLAGRSRWLRLAATLTAAQPARSQPNVRRSLRDHVLVLHRLRRERPRRRARAPDVPGPKGPLPGPGVKEVGLEQAYRGRQADRQEAGEPAGRAARRRPVRGRRRPARRRRGQGRAHVERHPARGWSGGGHACPRFGTVATTFPQAVTGKGAATRCRRRSRASCSARYRFDRYKTAKAETKPLTRITVLGSARADAKAAREAVKRGQVVAEAVCWARDLVNTPAGDMPPAQIAREAQKMAREVGLRCKVWGEARAREGRVRRHPRRRRRAA